MAVKLRRTKQEGHEARIEIVPLIDIMFFLLAAFILATLGLRQAQALAPVQLPTAGQTLTTPAGDLIVAVDATGTTTFEGRPLARNELLAALRARLANGRKVLIQGDARAPFAAMTKALETIGEAGFTEVRFAAETESSR
jgi:biopolymer transport protein ExbD